MSIFEKKKTEIIAEPERPVFNGTVIEEGMTFVGEFDSDEVIKILGTVEGHIKTSQNVYVAKTGLHKGSMEVTNMDVDGTVDADVFCKNTASFSVGSTFTGELTTVNFEASRGSNFRGKLNLIEVEDVKKHEAAEKAASVQEEH